MRKLSQKTNRRPNLESQVWDAERVVQRTCGAGTCSNSAAGRTEFNAKRSSLHAAFLQPLRIQARWLHRLANPDQRDPGILRTSPNRRP